MVVKIPVLCNGVPVQADLTISRMENLISTKLSDRLKLAVLPQRRFLYDEFERDISCLTGRVGVVIESAGQTLTIEASVITMGPELLLGSDTMARLGMRLQMGQARIPIPRRPPLTRDWVHEVLSEIERRLQGPQKGIPTCRTCQARGHLQARCPQKGVILTPNSSDSETDSSSSNSSWSPVSPLEIKPVLAPNPPAAPPVSPENGMETDHEEESPPISEDEDHSDHEDETEMSSMEETSEEEDFMTIEDRQRG